MTTPTDYNKKILDWGFATKIKLKQNISRLSHKGKGDLMRELSTKSRWYYGEIDRIVFEFPRHGVFLHKGVGRGYIVVGGKLTRGHREYRPTLGIKKKWDRQFVVTKGPIKRKPKDWFNAIMNQEVPQIANDIAQIRADLAINQIGITIK